MDESFDNELSRRLKQFSEEPDTNLWPSISARIEAEDRAVRIQKKERFGWIFIFSSIMIGGVFYFFNSEPPINRSIATAGTEQKITNSKIADVMPEVKVLQQQPQPQKAAAAEIKALHPGENAVGFESDFSPAIQTKAHVENVSETQSEKLEYPPDIELVTGNNPWLITEETLNSTNILETSETEAAKKPDEDQQESSKIEKKQNRLSIYFTIMPTLGYQRIEPNSNDNLIIESITRISTFSTDRLGVRAELGAEYPVANRFYVFGGLLYFQREQTIGYTEKVVSKTEVSEGPNGEIILRPEFSYLNKSFEYEVRNLGLQLGLSYQIAKRKFLQTLGTGIEFHLALNKVEEITEFTNNPSAYVFYNFYYRIQYPTDRKLRAVVQPTLNYSFYINQNLNAPFYVKPYGLGLNVGFTYNFN